MRHYGLGVSLIVLCGVLALPAPWPTAVLQSALNRSRSNIVGLPSRFPCAAGGDYFMYFTSQRYVL